MNARHADLEARFAAPAERDLPPGRHDLYRETLMNHMLTQPPASKPPASKAQRSRRTLLGGRLKLSGSRVPARVLAAAAVAAIAAAAAGYAIAGGSAPAARPPLASRPTASHPRPGQAVPQAVLAAEVLRGAAAHVAREGVTAEPAASQWIYDKTVSYGYPGVVDPSGVTTGQAWITFDGGQTAYYENGKVVTHTSTAPSPGPGATPWNAWNASATPKTAYDVLASLPASPQALLAVIARQAAGQNAQGIAAGNPVAGVAPRTQAQREFDYLTLILWNAADGPGGPPAAEAAAYRAMATLPGITVQQGIKDTAGGQAIGVSDDGGYDQLLIDPVSDQVIGIRQLSTGIGPIAIAQAKKKQHGSAYPAKGTLIQEIVYVQTAEVPAPGDR